MADKNIVKAVKRQRVKYRIRKRIIGTAEKPRLSVYRSLNHIYAQLINDEAGHTIAQVSSKTKGIQKESGKVSLSKAVGMSIAKMAKEKGIEVAVFDRNGYKYHGRIKAVADGAREAGLKL